MSFGGSTVKCTSSYQGAFENILGPPALPSYGN